MKILITGASGFIGSFAVEEALRRGFDTWAGVRPSSSRRYLQEPGLNFIDLDFSSTDRLTEQLRGHRFDYIVHAAGVTKCKDEKDFYNVNTEGTRHLVEALLRLKMPLRKLVYLSSLSVFGAVREQEPHTEIEPTDTPRPNTAYGRSKLEAEKVLDTLGKVLPLVVLRPTGVYGPREKDYFMMAQSIARHMDFSVGYSRQDITFIYVSDLVDAIFLALDHGKDHGKYFLSDGSVYTSRDFSDYLHEALGRPWWLRVKAPLWLLRLITTVGGAWGKATGRMTVLNHDKYNILSQRNWMCDIRPAREELGYEPQVKLREGAARAVEWYKANGWL